ncbi:helix-turn-helix domain-containing protein [Pseudomonas sp. RIT-PI-AD]|uniref:transcriptional regulator n=1 Tax=Pseudomonas sp. RIT-PI-AD TaxID=3035294 RepID=UPI0021D8D17F|nr:helix-turn-helix domain-containing protein [Pseudomonas sp. RIT-PI-AD]
MTQIVQHERLSKALKVVWKGLTVQQRVEAASAAGTSVEYLRQVLACGRPPGAPMAKAIEKALGGRVTRQQLRPDVFDDAPCTN